MTFFDVWVIGAVFTLGAMPNDVKFLKAALSMIFWPMFLGEIWRDK
jgi:hypothetical protein